MRRILLQLSSLLLCFSSFGQIKIDKSKTAEQYVKDVFIGTGIEVQNITSIGMVGGIGKFDADEKIIGFKSGLVLSTGNVDSIIGPNNKGGYTSSSELPTDKKLQRKLLKGDKDLSKIGRGRSKDITVIEFDFIPTNNVLEFKYVFASEEYNEKIGADYNDAICFVLSGPGIKRKKNLAVLPDGKTPINVNAINKHSKYKRSFRLNGGTMKRLGYSLNKLFASEQKRNARGKNLMQLLQFDGLTKVLTVQKDVIPYRKYHIKIGIGDIGDKAYDSGLFLEAGSFISFVDSTALYSRKLDEFKPVSLAIDSIFKNDVIPDSAEDVEVNEKFEFTDIYFDYNMSAIPDSCKSKLDSLAAYLKANKNFTCTLFGNTDNTGSKEYNQTLSEKRALEVKKYLLKMGVSDKRVIDEGHNFNNPKYDNSTEEGRARNRRVEILVE